LKKQLTAGRIVCYLFCLSLVCAVVFGVSYARYMTTVNGTATATVAAVSDKIAAMNKIDVSDMEPGATKIVDFNVVNFSDKQVSEVGQDYTVMVKTSGNLPFEFTLASAGGASEAGAKNFAGNLVKKENVWESTSSGNLLASVSTTHSYTLTVFWPEGEGKPDYADEIDTVTLIIDAKQTMPAAAN